jgi:hydrogenase maturation factor
MCLSELGRVIDHDAATRMASIDVDGRVVAVSTVALGIDDPHISTGDWLLVHTGLAVERLTHAEAAQIVDARRSSSSREPPANGDRKEQP